VQGEKNRGARSVLNAAAWTYVAMAIYAALQLVQLLLMRGDRKIGQSLPKKRGGASRRFLLLQ
jgi:hypothetical protein